MASSSGAISSCNDEQLSDEITMKSPCHTGDKQCKVGGDVAMISPTHTGEKPKASGGHREPQLACDAVLLKSDPLSTRDLTQVKGYDFNHGVDHHALLDAYRVSGFQATNFGKAVEELNRMLLSRVQPMPEDMREDVYESDPFLTRTTNCTIFLGYTSNMVSSGVRESIRFLVEHRLVDCLVTSAGGVEEDLIKCLAPTFLGQFHLPGHDLRKRGINRIGNLLVPNDNYCKFEDWVMPILDTVLKEQKESGDVWSPSKLISRLGAEINDPSSICYWANRNRIPVFCPALTDGSLGDMIYFHSYRNPGLVLDIVQDIRRLNTIAVRACNTGVVILGGGLIKHHILNANLMRNGTDYAVIVNTASEFDGSDSGARPDEAVSWGKIKPDATPVKVYADATLVFPLLVAETFARHHHSKQPSTTDAKTHTGEKP